MLVRNADDYFEMTVAERSPAARDAGDTRFAARLRVSGIDSVFTADAQCWVELQALAAFAEQLRVLEERRQGTASLESMSPGELRLQICNTDRTGHMAAIGQVGRRFVTGSAEPCWSAVAFRVPVCPTELPALVREFVALASAPNAEPEGAAGGGARSGYQSS
jgi:hypothetical protein